MIGLGAEQSATAQRGKLGFGGAVNNIHAEAGFATHAFDKFIAIGRATTRFRGDAANAAHIGASYFAGANPQGGNGAFHRVIG